MNKFETINSEERVSGRTLDNIKVGGKDRFSVMSIHQLESLVEEGSVFLHLKEQRATVLRWCLRGLRIDLAIRKVDRDTKKRKAIAERSGYSGERLFADCDPANIAKGNMYNEWEDQGIPNNRP